MKIETATADELYRLLLDIQDRLGELVRDDRLTLTRDAEQIYGTARNAAGVVAHHLDEARQVLAVLEPETDCGPESQWEAPRGMLTRRRFFLVHPEGGRSRTPSHHRGFV